MTRDKLDKLLSGWAARHPADEARTDSLADRIVEELARRGYPAAERRAEQPLAMRRAKKVAYAALAAAAGLLICIAALFLSGRRPGRDRETAGSPVASIAQAELQTSARLFGEMERLFADHLRWVADSEGRVRLGVRPVVGGVTPGATPLLIRVVVVERRSGQASWRKLLETDVLTRSEELIEVVPDPKLDNRLLLWGHLLPDGNVALDSSIRLTSPIRAGIEVTNVFAPGKPAKVFSLRTEAGEYRVFQAVTPLPKYEDTSCTET